MISPSWEDKYNTGLEAMDVQHRKIFDYLTTIYRELGNNFKKCDPFNRMLDQLELLCQIHFMDEERLMEEIDFPLVAEHKRLHDLFLATIDRLKVENNHCHAPSIVKDFNNLIEDFITHMLNETTLLSEFINSQTKRKLSEESSQTEQQYQLTKY